MGKTQKSPFRPLQTNTKVREGQVFELMDESSQKSKTREK
jgi:hypothetical protein